ncbi:glycosyltransferase [Phytohabitans suffuscus]|uniref:glycosyltransferase n=1 Tax=Phytohabitans suffuscus TaxID=624315 RepID=UPI0038CD71B2
MLAAAPDVDADFLLALGPDPDLTPLGPLPANVHPVGWVPLHHLLTGTAAVVHHGGSGTTMAALGAGVPQLVLPHGADQFINAAAVADLSIGTWCPPAEVDAATVTKLLADATIAATAQTAAARMAALPTPPTSPPPHRSHRPLAWFRGLGRHGRESTNPPRCELPRCPPRSRPSLPRPHPPRFKPQPRSARPLLRRPAAPGTVGTSVRLTVVRSREHRVSRCRGPPRGGSVCVVAAFALLCRHLWADPRASIKAWGRSAR